MRDVTQDSITDAFIDYFGEDTNPRVREVMASLARHLHAFALETQLTHAEWNQGLDVLRQAGEITTPQRDEFVLLSDVLGLSSLVDMINSSDSATSSSVLGPFHISNPPSHPMGADLRKDYAGELVLVEGCVLDQNGKPIDRATIDIWQTAPNGMYSSQDPEQDEFSFHALFKTSADGRYRFTTVRPVSYTIPTDGPVGILLNATDRHPWRPSHLHYIVKASGYQPLVTEVFPDDDPYLDQDTVFGVRSDLVISYEKQKAGQFPSSGLELSGQVDEDFSRVHFDITLAPE